MTNMLDVEITNVAIATGVAQLLDSYARVRPHDRGLICYTPDSRTYAAHLSIGLRARGVAHDLVAMLPLVDSNFPALMQAKLPAPDSFTGSLVVFTLERDTMSHFEQFVPLFAEYGVARCRILRVISASDEFFTQSLRLSPDELAALNATLLATLQLEDRVRVHTPGGTDLEIELDHEKYQWISNRGAQRPGGFTILPPGEIATYPAKVDGVLVADGAINCNIISNLDMRLGRCPLRVDIVNSVAQSVDCDDPDLRRLVEDCFSRRNGRRIGELGFGTNQALRDFVPHNSHLNERHPSLHLGFGQHNQPLTVVDYDADIHLDLITDDATVDLPRQERSVRMSTVVAQDGVEHPRLIRDEDITGDCCAAGCSRIAL